MESTARPAASRRTAAALWASAAVIAALILVQGSRLTGETARADVVSTTGSLTVLTFEGQNEDLIAVLDARSEQIMLYRVVNRNALELQQSYSVARMFSDAANRAATGRR
jgi:uncharacterized membrane protein